MIASNLQKIQSTLPDGVTLVAVSKTKPASDIQSAYDFGQRDFGENKAQEIVEKYDQLPTDLRWHFIGHLQTNKIKQIIDKVYLIHSVDRSNLFQALEKEAAKIDRVVDVLLQFHIAQEESKHGFSWQEALDFLQTEFFQTAKHLRVVGVMGMATFTDNTSQIQKEFETLKTYFDTLKNSVFKDAKHFQVVSMGMSGDYELAMSCGGNMVRVGSAIFGVRG
jgi:pyridoxal phosphate enzyme (YggS family)